MKPRNSTSELKRKASSSPNQTDEDCSDAKVRKTEFKREYSKLRKLVPALNARNDITKVIHNCNFGFYFGRKQSFLGAEEEK